MTNDTEAQFFAAIDLGSNSFHMVVAKFTDGHIQIIDRIKEMVRLADGLDDARNLDTETMERTIACLERFGQRIREIPGRNIRAVGTNTLRQARNSPEFISRARQALGHRIEIIAGREEARLIYLGVAHSVHKENEQRLVIDIGGGSTEIIIGRDFQPRLTESLYMGCVSMTKQFFNNGNITAKRMRKAILFARQEMEAIENLYRRVGWKSAIGSSGTVTSIAKVIALQGWGQGGISASALQQLRDALIKAGQVDKINLKGLSADRQPVFVGGVAVLSGIVESLNLEEIAVSDGALREGLLYELIGREQAHNVREQTINELQQRYNVDTEHAERIEITAQYCYAQVFNSGPATYNDNHEQQLLSWAARLHEMGQAIAHSGYQKHGAYIAYNSDLAGFSRQEQHYLAILIRNHRRKFNKTEFNSLPDNGCDRISWLCLILRVAIVLNRSRSSSALPEFSVQLLENGMHLQFPADWLAQQPLTEADLETEKGYLAAAGYTLSFS